MEKCILDENNNLIEGAADALDFLKVTGVKVILTSIRSNTHNTDLKTVNKNMAELKKILKDCKVFYNYLDYGNKGKPVCSYYIEPQHDTLSQKLGQSLKKDYGPIKVG